MFADIITAVKTASNRVRDIQRFANEQLAQLYPPDEIRSLCYWLFEHYCGLDRSRIAGDPGLTLHESELLNVYDAILELKTGKPVQYITGTAYFCGLEIEVNPPVLIPRPETEELAGMAIRTLNKIPACNVLDIGTGSGCIAIALKKQFPGCHVAATDISEEALQTARRNAARVAADVVFIRHDILNPDTSPALPPATILISNPPYVLPSDRENMHINVLSFEPGTALFVPEDDPLIFYRHILTFAKNQSPGAQLLFEIHENAGISMMKLAEDNGIAEACIHKDFRGKDRFFTGMISP